MTPNTALILIDFQQGFDAPVWGKRNNPNAENCAAELLNHWRANGWPLFHIRHISTEVGSPLSGAGCDFRAGLTPLANEKVLDKSVNSSFIGTDLESQLHKVGAKDLVICGLTTPHCVSTTTRMAANLGFNVYLVEDACAAYKANANMSWRSGAEALSAQTIHDTALAHLHGEFAQVVSTNQIIESKV